MRQVFSAWLKYAIKINTNPTVMNGASVFIKCPSVSTVCKSELTLLFSVKTYICAGDVGF
jgi:hypothetical protein